jgi:hypothetical protein
VILHLYQQPDQSLLIHVEFEEQVSDASKKLKTTSNVSAIRSVYLKYNVTPKQTTQNNPPPQNNPPQNNQTATTVDTNQQPQQNQQALDAQAKFQAQQAQAQAQAKQQAEAQAQHDQMVNDVTNQLNGGQNGQPADQSQQVNPLDVQINP